MFQNFQKEFLTISYTSNCFQTIVFTKSDDNNSKLSQAYHNQFDIFNVPIIVCSAKENSGFTKINDTLINFCSKFSTARVQAKAKEEELLLYDIEIYSQILSKKYSRLAKK